MVMPWIRQIQVSFSGDGGGLSLYSSSEGLDITVKCTKYLTSNRDTCTITIKNLPSGFMSGMAGSKQLNVDVYAGYSNTGLHHVFSGGVTNFYSSKRASTTSSVTVFCTSKLLARFQQQKLELEWKENTSLFEMAVDVFDKAGISGRERHIDHSLMDDKLSNAQSGNMFVTEWINTIIGLAKEEYVTFTDPIYDGSVISILRGDTLSGRSVGISSADVSMATQPTITMNGLEVYVVPKYNLACGMYMGVSTEISNMIESGNIQMLSTQDATAYMIDPDGQYLIYQLDYDLNSRDGENTVKVTGISKAKYNGILQDLKKEKENKNE